MEGRGVQRSVGAESEPVMYRQRPRRAMSTNLVLAVAGLLVLVIVLVVLIEQRRIQEQIVQTEQDLAVVQLGEPIADRLSSLPGFVQLTTIAIGEFPPAVVTVYRKSVGSRHATGIQWDICVGGDGRVIEIRREGAGP